MSEVVSGCIACTSTDIMPASTMQQPRHPAVPCCHSLLRFEVLEERLDAVHVSPAAQQGIGREVEAAHQVLGQLITWLQGGNLRAMLVASKTGSGCALGCSAFLAVR